MPPRTRPLLLCLTLLFLVLLAHASRRPAAASAFSSPSRLRMRLLSSDADGANESLILRGRLPGAPRGAPPCFFLVDTGYAGAPVLSTTYLAALAAVIERCALGLVA